MPTRMQEIKMKINLIENIPFLVKTILIHPQSHPARHTHTHPDTQTHPARQTHTQTHPSIHTPTHTQTHPSIHTHTHTQTHPARHTPVEPERFFPLGIWIVESLQNSPLLFLHRLEPSLPRKKKNYFSTLNNYQLVPGRQKIMG